MQETVLVALISSAASLLVGVVALWQALRIGQRQAATQRAIAAFEAASEEGRPQLKVIAEVWANLQKIKHSLDVAMLPTRFGLYAALDSLDEAVESLKTEYEAHGSELPDYLRRAWHDAKNYGMSVRADVIQRVRDFPTTAPLPNDAREWMIQTRASVTAFQMSLEDGREQYRRELLDSIGEALQHAER